MDRELLLGKFADEVGLQLTAEPILGGAYRVVLQGLLNNTYKFPVRADIRWRGKRIWRCEIKASTSVHVQHEMRMNAVPSIFEFTVEFWKLPPAAPALEPFWRVGRSVGRTIYEMVGDDPSGDDKLIGMMDTPELAQTVVDNHNEQFQEENWWDDENA